MSAYLRLPPRLRRGIDALASHIDALQNRERACLMLAALALLAALEWAVVWPLQERRSAIATAGQQAEQEQTDAADAEQQAAAGQRNQLEATLQGLEHDLQRLGGAKASGEPLTFLLQRLLAREPARIESLRELALEEIDAAALNQAPPAPDANPAAPAITLYRHRFELTLSGEPASLVSAVRALDSGARPLRIERVRLAASATAGAAGVLRATVTLSVIGAERTWLSI
jgi:hypothetical protein